MTHPNAATSLTALHVACGAGGTSLGFERAGIRTAYAFDINPVAVSTHQHNMPWAPAEVRDLYTVAAQDLPAADVFCCGIPCFAPGTLILTRAGYVPIEEIEVGDEVLSHIGRWRKVTATSTRQSSEYVRIKAQGVVDLLTTSEHPFWSRAYRVWKSHLTTHRLYSEPAWLPAASLTGEHWLSQRLPEAREDADQHSCGFWSLVGRYVAEGWRARRVDRPTGKVVICANDGEADDLLDLLRTLGFNPSVTRERTVIKFHIYSKMLWEFLEPFGAGASNKLLPGYVFELPQDKARAFLLGYLTGDGWYGRNGRQDGDSQAWGVTTTSKALAYSIALLAQRAFRVVATVTHWHSPTTCVIEGRQVNQADKWKVLIPNRNRSAFIEGDLGWKKVREVSREPGGPVFNLSVDEDESYIAEGAIVHNCEAYSTAGYQRGLADERDISPEVARLLRDLRAAGKAPRYVFLENVPPYMKSPAAEMIRQALHGYRIAEAIFKHADYGVCQKRERWHLIAALQGPVPLPTPTHSEQPGFTTMPWVTFDVIREDFPADPHYVSAKAWRGIIRRQTVNEIKAIERAGSTNTSFAKCYIVDDDDLMPTVLASWWRGHSRNQATIVFDDYRFRAPTRLEVSRAQGFPDDFEFLGNVREQYEMIARAVPPPFATAVARAIVAAERERTDVAGDAS